MTGTKRIASSESLQPTSTVVAKKLGNKAGEVKKNSFPKVSGKFPTGEVTNAQNANFDFEFFRKGNFDSNFCDLAKNFPTG